MSGSIVLKEKSLLQSSTPQAPRNRLDSRLYRAGGFRFSDREYLQSVSAPGPGCWAQHKEHRNFIPEAAAQTLWICAIIRACFLCDRWPNSIFQSLEILQNRKKCYALGVYVDVFRVRFLMRSKVRSGWSKLRPLRSLKRFKFRNWNAHIFIRTQGTLDVGGQK